MAREKKLQPFGETPESFRGLKDDGVYYVDKTGFIPYLITQKRKICVVTRPRRFGKTLMLGMLQTFFEYRLDEDGKLQVQQQPRLRHHCWMHAHGKGIDIYRHE